MERNIYLIQFVYKIIKLCTYSNELIQLEYNDYSSLKKLFIEWKKQKDLKLNKKLLEILKYFVSNPFAPSSYQCYKYLVTNKIINLDKKNVRRNIEKLHKLGLLQERKPKNGQWLHNATFYKLSPFAIFYLLKEGIMNNPFDFNPDIILKYRSTKLYCIILYKFINLETLKQIKSRFILNKILLYLNRICIMIENLFDFITNQSLLLESMEKIGGLLLTDSFIFDYLFSQDMIRNKVFLLHFNLSKNQY